eukprot:1637301-Pleurochrysis_carterae.AAC.3
MVGKKRLEQGGLISPRLQPLHRCHHRRVIPARGATAAGITAWTQMRRRSLVPCSIPPVAKNTSKHRSQVAHIGTHQGEQA